LSQKENDNFTFEINFEPSFVKCSKINLASSGILEIVIFERGDNQEVFVSEKVKINSENKIKLFSFLESYEFKIKSRQDTIGTEKYFSNGDSVTAYIITEGIDGVEVNGRMTRAHVNHKFSFWSPKKGTENYTLVEILFAIFNSSFLKAETLNYLKELKNYFD
jgi:hypothetical protein